MQKEIGQKGFQLLDNGYKIVPIKLGEKHPKTPNWPKIRATKADVNKWSKSSYYGGFGVLGEFFPGIDIDVSDFEIVKKLVIWIQKNIGNTPIRLGNKPRVLIPCQSPLNKKIGHIQTTKYVDKNKKFHQIEIKASGRQWVAYSIHKDIKKPYTWHCGDLANYSANKLPVLTSEKIGNLFEYFYSIIPDTWSIEQEFKINPKGYIVNDSEIINNISFDNYVPPINISIDKLKSMLSRLHPDKYVDGLGWRTVGMALYHQFNGSQEGMDLFDEWSKKSMEYDYEEIKTRWPSWNVNTYSGNPITAATIIKMYKKVSEKSEDPTLKRKSQKLSDWEKRYAIVELPDKTEVYDMGVPIWMSKQKTLNAFKEHTAAYLHKIILPDGSIKFIPMVEAWKSSFNTRHFSGYVYQPGDKRYCRKEFAFGDKSMYINTFFFSPHNEKIEEVEIKERIKLFFRFLSHLFPEKEERKFIIMWLARMIQDPSVRSFVTPLNITPITGTGRGLFFEIIRHLIGGHNCHDVSKDDLEGRFNGYLDKCILAVVQEIKSATGDRKYQMWEQMKRYLADTTANIQMKGKDSYTATIRANFLMFSNNINALPIEDIHERRIFATKGALCPISADDVDRIVKWMHNADNIASLFSYLKQYPVDHDAFKRAKVTETKRQMVVASAGESKIDISEWLIKNAPVVFDFDYALEKLSEYSQDIEERGLTRQAFRQYAADIGWITTRLSFKGKRVYAYYNPAKFKGNKQLLKAYYRKLKLEK